MPIYEYRCSVCRKLTTAFLLAPNDQTPQACSHCGSPAIQKLISRFAAVRSEESLLEDFSDPSKFADLDEKDPRTLAKFMKKMGQEMGEELPADFDEMAEKAAETGEFPESGGPPPSNALDME